MKSSKSSNKILVTTKYFFFEASSNDTPARDIILPEQPFLPQDVIITDITNLSLS